MDALMLLLILYILLEVNYFLRLLVMLFYAKVFAKRTHLLEPGTSYGVCMLNDLDFMLHMNNSRYLREFEFARNYMALTNQLVDACLHFGGSAVLSAITVRYRRPIRLFQVYRVQTKVISGDFLDRAIYWSEQDFYLEQNIETVGDDFVRATCLAKVHLVNVKTAQLFHHILNEDLPESPEPTEELRHWMECNRISSEKLRKCA